MGKKHANRTCKDWAKGTCRFNHCKFRHDWGPEGAPPGAERERVATRAGGVGGGRFCCEWQRGRCYYGAACKFVHGWPEGERPAGADQQQEQQQQQPPAHQQAQGVKQERFHPYARPDSSAGGSSKGRGGGDANSIRGGGGKPPLEPRDAHQQHQQHHHQQHQQHHHQHQQHHQQPTPDPQMWARPPTPGSDGRGATPQDAGWGAAPAMPSQLPGQQQQQQALPREPEQQQQQQQPGGKAPPANPFLDRARFICAQVGNAEKIGPLLVPNAEALTLAAMQKRTLFRDSPFADSVEALVCGGDGAV